MEELNETKETPVIQTTEINENKVNDALADFFKSSSSMSGEEEMLKIASTYSIQISSKQIKLLLYLRDKAELLRSTKPDKSKRLEAFIDKWIELKRYNNSASFVMRALESISLRKFINENSMKVNIQK